MARILKTGAWLTLDEPDGGTLVLEGADPVLTTQIMDLHVDLHAQPRIGGRLGTLLSTPGFGELELDAASSVRSDFEVADRAVSLQGAANRGVSQGVGRRR